MNRDALLVSTSIGLALQLAMVVAGHYLPPIRDKGFAIGGMAISLVAGLLYARLAHEGWPESLGGGAIAGAGCAALAIGVSVLLKDTPTPVLAFGTLASAVTGVVGAAIGGRWADIEGARLGAHSSVTLRECEPHNQSRPEPGVSSGTCSRSSG